MRPWGKLAATVSHIIERALTETKGIDHSALSPIDALLPANPYTKCQDNCHDVTIFVTS